MEQLAGQLVRQKGLKSSVLRDLDGILVVGECGRMPSKVCGKVCCLGGGSGVWVGFLQKQSSQAVPGRA